MNSFLFFSIIKIAVFYIIWYNSHMIYKTDNEEQTMKLGTKLAQNLSGGDIISLDGELGAGKTVFTRGLAKGLGVNSAILSPTFVLMRQYKGKELLLYHFDMYRLENWIEARDAGLYDFIGSTQAVTVIEWAEKIKDNLPKIKYQINITLDDKNKRLVEII